MNKNQLSYSVGLSVTLLPQEIVEEEINYSPTLSFNVRYGLFDKWSLVGTFNRNYITNKLDWGLNWNNSLYQTIYYSVGLFASGWYTHINIDAIKSNTFGISLKPQVSFGYALDKIKFSTQFESHHHIFWNYLEKEYLGSNKIYYSGASINLITEQRFMKNVDLAIALRFHYTKFHYQAWIAYSILDEYLFFPELYFGVVF